MNTTPKTLLTRSDLQHEDRSVSLCENGMGFFFIFTDTGKQAFDLESDDMNYMIDLYHEQDVEMQEDFNHAVECGHIDYHGHALPQ